MIKPIEYVNEASDYRLAQHVAEGDLVACITAFRNPVEIIQNVSSLRERFPDWKDLLDEDASLSPKDERRKTELLNQVLHINRQRNEYLEDQLRNFHWGFNKIEGHWVEDNSGDVVEETFLVFAPASQEEELTNFLISANRAYNQDCSLLVIDGCAYYVNKYRLEETPVGNISVRPQELGRAYSKIKGKPFRFGAVVESCEIKPKCTSGMDFRYYHHCRHWLKELREDYCQQSIGKGKLIGADW